MEIDLEKREWVEFLFKDIFVIKSGFYNKKPLSLNKGDIPFLGATANNNGVTQFNTFNEIDDNSKVGYGKNEPIEKKIFKGNCIAVTNNGSVGFAYYQSHDFTCSHDINPLYLRNIELNQFIAKFLITAIEKQKVCFEYARKWRPKRMVKSKILLPINNKGEPDYAFMEQYMQHQEKNKLEDYIKLLEKHIVEWENNKFLELSKKQWVEFDIQDIFNINSGKRLVKSEMKKGVTPFVGASDSNNGITEYVSNNNSSLDSNVLGVNYNGSVGENFYHPYDALFSDDVKRFSLKKIVGNKYHYLFFKVTILRQKSKYQYGYKFNEKRMLKQKIVLPVNSKLQPDYDFMEAYMRNIERRKIEIYKKYISARIRALEAKSLGGG